MITKFTIFQDKGGNPEAFMGELDAVVYITIETGDYHLETTQLYNALCKCIRNLKDVTNEKDELIPCLHGEEFKYTREKPTGESQRVFKIQ